MANGILFIGGSDTIAAPLALMLAKSLLAPGQLTVSAGLMSGTVSPAAIAAFAEWGIAETDIKINSIADVDFASITRIITLSPEAARNCPVPAGIPVEHWTLPAIDQTLENARALRDALYTRIAAMAAINPPEPALGVIGGSGFYNMPGVAGVEEMRIATPFGDPSDVIFVGRLQGKRIAFLPRHGRGHHLLPSEVNVRANMYAMKRLGVTRILSVSAVGSLREDIAPGHVVFPRQFIDRTVGRRSTFFGGGVVAHVSLADPICNSLASIVAACAKDESGVVHEAGTYLCMEGPQFSTRAESHLYRSWGADVIGMTNATEAKAAREAGICYATLAFPTDYDCWRTATEEVKVEEIIAILRANVAKGQRIVAAAAGALDPAADCSCHHALDFGLMTPRESLAIEARFRLHAILEAQVAEQVS